jgi:radical SAM-linked protein
MLALKKGSALKVRYLIKFKKGSDIKFVAHLDIMRAIQRTFKRAQLPVDYSNGFNPHMKLSIAQPLSVGMYSIGEYLDIDFKEEVNNEDIINKFNSSSTKDLELLQVVPIKELYDKDGKKIPQSMATVDNASYEIRIKYENTNSLEAELLNLLKESEWNIIKKTKNGEKEANIKPLIKEFKFEIQDKFLCIEALVSCGSRENLSADLLSKYIKTHTHNIDEIAFTEIKRIEIYGIRGNKLLPLCEYFKIFA